MKSGMFSKLLCPKAPAPTGAIKPPEAPVRLIGYEGYRFSATGLTLYAMYSGDRAVCRVSTAPMPDQQRRYDIRGEGLHLTRRCAESPTLFYGVRYPIREGDSDEVAAEVEYLDARRFRLLMPEGSVDVEVLTEGGYLYSRGGRLVAGFFRRDDPARTREEVGDAACASYQAWCEEALPDRTRTLLLCLPFLGIC